MCIRDRYRQGSHKDNRRTEKQRLKIEIDEHLKIEQGKLAEIETSSDLQVHEERIKAKVADLKEERAPVAEESWLPSLPEYDRRSRKSSMKI